MQIFFDTAYQHMKTNGLKDDALELRAAIVYWYVHTEILEDEKYCPREHVRDDAGHAGMKTTGRYIESDNRERHTSGKMKKIKDI